MRRLLSWNHCTMAFMWGHTGKGQRYHGDGYPRRCIHRRRAVTQQIYVTLWYISTTKTSGVPLSRSSSLPNGSRHAHPSMPMKKRKELVLTKDSISAKCLVTRELAELCYSVEFLQNIEPVSEKG